MTQGWIQGIPTVEQVARHEKDHCVFPDGKPGTIVISKERLIGKAQLPGSGTYPATVKNTQSVGNWVCVNRYDYAQLRLTPDPPELLGLRVVDGEILVNTHSIGYDVLIQHCDAATASFFPVGPNGLPITLRDVICSYCGDIANYDGLTDAERNSKLLDHIVTCPKRPEMKLVKVALAAEDVLDAWAIWSGHDYDDVVDGPMDRLRAELDKLKVQPETKEE